jgi:hypothetical protein
MYPTNSKIVLTIFSDVRVSMVLGFLAWISKNYEIQRFAGKPYVKEFLVTVFEFI